MSRPESRNAWVYDGGAVVEEAARPEEGSPEDQADRRRCAELHSALQRTGDPVLPGSPDVVAEIAARIAFLQFVLAGKTCEEALATVRSCW